VKNGLVSRSRSLSPLLVAKAKAGNSRWSSQRCLAPAPRQSAIHARARQQCVAVCCKDLSRPWVPRSERQYDDV